MGVVFYNASINGWLFWKSKRRVPELHVELDIDGYFYFSSHYFINGYNKMEEFFLSKKIYFLFL
jgi:hypothetical protein